MQLKNMTHTALLLHICVQLVNSEIPENDLHIWEKFLILIKFGKWGICGAPTDGKWIYQHPPHFF